MLEKIKLDATKCTCERCNYSWLTQMEGEKPRRCAKCKTPYWDSKIGERKRGRKRIKWQEKEIKQDNVV